MSDARPSRTAPPGVLVVDDDADYLEFMRVLLESEGYVVRLAASLQEAAAALDNVSPGLVICDVYMPDAPPFAMLDRLAADRATASIPVLLCSGALRQLEAAERVARPNVQMLLKPFDIEVLLARVAACLSLV